MTISPALYKCVWMCRSCFAYGKYYQWSLWWLQFSFDPHTVTRALELLCGYGFVSLMGFLPSLHFPLFLFVSLPLFEAPPPLHWAHQWGTLQVLTLSGGGQCQVRDLLLGYHQISGGKTEHRVALSFSACHVISFICWQLPERHRRLSSLSCHN